MEEAPQNWQMFAGLAVLIIGLFAWLRSDIRRLDDRMGGVEREVTGIKAEIGGLKRDIEGVKAEVGEVRDSLGAEIREVREEVVSLKVDVGFIRGKLDLLERYIMRRNDPAAEPAE